MTSKHAGGETRRGVGSRLNASEPLPSGARRRQYDGHHLGEQASNDDQ